MGSWKDRENILPYTLFFSVTNYQSPISNDQFSQHLVN
ncbi:hypothetical protein B6N60_01863 [Richelia sinica FACHB-800]|uniref:Uncharacterized protein n=1 Tax=Richelia sinica FACHB-800 TaxID=1357546 RepID=A0A975Y4H3_9NOST|nr:hypothetical protein B6N60_01863 [Richelia sinica FACHB-800]